MTERKVTEHISELAIMPIELLPDWYWGVATLGAVSLGVANHNGVIDSPIWMSAGALYGPFVPAVLLVATLLVAFFALCAVLGILLAATWTIVVIRDGSVSLFRWTRNILRRKNKSATSIMADVKV